MARPAAALLLAIASLASAATVQAQIGPLDDPAAERIRAAFKVDGIALFDAHARHAKRMGVCAPSVFAGLKWCVTGTTDETRGDVVYAKTTGYNIDAEERIVYAISTRRGYPLKRAAFDGIVQAIGERYGAGPTMLAFKKAAGESAGVDSLIAVWGGLRLVPLTDAEYAQVESGQSLQRGHLVDHRFSLVVSAKQRDPIYKIEGEAGFILQLMANSPDRADVIARAVYPPVFLPPPGKPGPEAAHPLVNETVRRAPRAAASEAQRAPAGDDRGRRVEAERGLAAERLLREEAERKAADEKAVRAEVERLTAAERRAAAAEQRRLEAARKAAEDRAARAEAALKAQAERRSLDEARRSPAGKPAPRADAQRAEDARKAAADEARRAAAKRADAERKAAAESRVAERNIAAAPAAPPAAAPPAQAATPDSAQRPAPDAAAPTPGAVWMLSETRVRGADERTLRAQAFFGATGEGQASRVALAVTFECTIVGRDGRLRAHARGFDRETGAGIAFRTGGEDSFGVRTRFALDGAAPRSGLLFREHQDDIASFLELPISAAERERNAPRAAIWLRHAAVTIEFPLAAGTVSATIAPQAGNLRRVLEACAR